MKRIFSAFLALVLALGLCVPSLAASGEPSADYGALSLAEAQWVYDETNDAWCLTDAAYCLNPAAPDVQYLNIYVPGAYLDADGVQTEAVKNGYNAATAPILLANDIGGYAQAKPTSVSRCAQYLARGYVVVCPGVRGRDTVDADGNYVGTGCAGAADLKACVRFLKYNDAWVAGDADCIVSIGRSAGGALSALLACSGNNPAYDPYLEAMGAVMSETDDIYAAQCYCPITDIENQSMNYEWFYHDSLTAAASAASGEASGEAAEEETEMNPFQRALSDDLAALFVDYVNDLGLTDGSGAALTLDGLREGSYYDYVMSELEGSLADYIQKTCSVVKGGMSAYTYIDEAAAQACVDALNADGDWVSLDFSYAVATTGPSTTVTYASGCNITMTGLADFTARCHSREKLCPAFDGMDYSDPCCALFADAAGNPSHFDARLAGLLSSGAYEGLEGFDAAAAAAYAALDVPAELALLNPAAMLDGSDAASFVRIRTGTRDMASSFVEGMNAALALAAKTDAVVDYALAWDQPHGDAEIDSEDLFTWLERICKFEKQHSDAQIASLLNLDNMEYSWTLSGSGDAAYYLLSPVVDVANPELAAYQGVSVAIPAYYVAGVNEDGSLAFDYDYEFENANGAVYTAATAPVIVNTGAAGYSAGSTGRAGGGYVNYGYINVACGNRGKSLSAVDAAGESYFCGDAPYCLVDQKACVRWLKYNIALGNLCGDGERIVSTGGSGGGAHSLMLAATGNNPDFYPYLEESGAVMRFEGPDGTVEISDGIWGCCPYSAITNLEEANMAYEFESGLAAGDALLSRYSAFRQLLSQGEAEQYMAYINAKGLTWDLDGDGRRDALTIEYDAEKDVWSGSFIELMEQFMEQQLEWYLNHLDENELDWALSFDGESYAEAYLRGDYVGGGSGEMGSGEASGEQEEEGYASAADEEAKTGTGEDLTGWVRWTVDEDGAYDVDFDIGDFIVYRGRSKTNPAFDDLNLGQAENQEFGDADQDFKHWDVYVLAAMEAYYDALSAAYDGTDAAAASFEELCESYRADVEEMLAGDKFGQNIVALYNPANYILDEATDLPAWVHIVHGTADTDSSTLISMVDAIEFDMAGVDTFVAWSWDDPHVAGDPIGTTMTGYVDAMAALY